MRMAQVCSAYIQDVLNDTLVSLAPQPQPQPNPAQTELIHHTSHRE